MDVKVVRVFASTNGSFGNSLGIVARPLKIDAEMRLATTRNLGFAETVFIDDITTSRLEIYSAAGPLPFAGHPLVGTGWLLTREEGESSRTLRPPAGEVPFWMEGDDAWIAGKITDCPEWSHRQLDSASSVCQLEGVLDPTHDAMQYWAWVDEAAGTIRARTFGSRFGIPEDEACGSASMVLASILGRSIEVQHGEGSRILARPGEKDGEAAVGGLVVQDATIGID